MTKMIDASSRTGTSVELVVRTRAASGPACIAACDDVEIRLAEPARTVATRPKSSSSTKNDKANPRKVTASDLDTIFKRLLKLKPTKRATAANSIKAMFQFGAPISDEAANKIL